MKTITKWILLLVIAISSLPVNQLLAQFQTGDVFVGVASGSVQWRRPNGTLVQTLNGGAGGFTTGMAFDSAQSLYVTNFSNSVVHRFDKNGVQISNFGSGYSTPECIVFDGSWNAYVGNIGGGFRKFDALGNFVSTVASGTRIDFADLQADQSTMLYTQEGSTIGRWDVVNNVALTNFATGLGGNAYALRIRTNGEVLLANGSTVLRLSSAGAVIQTYDVAGQNSWFALNLDPDGTSFWSADFSTSNVYRIDIASGNVISTFNTGTGNGTVFGLAVAGEITVATQLFITVAPLFDINPINTQHCVTATVVDQNNVPQNNVTIDWNLVGVNGPNSTTTQTGANGETQFCYVGANVGYDTIIATIRSTGAQARAVKLWESSLPVELTSFTSTVSGTDVNLNWATSKEINNSGFDIERSVIAGEWTKVGNVTGNGTTNETKLYSFTDKNLASGKYNYRLKQIDYNGNYEYFNLSNEIEIGVPQKFDLAQNYPNPFNPSTKINFALPKDGNIVMSVFDNSGRLVSKVADGFRTAGYYTVDFSAANLSSGVYFYKLEFSGSGSEFTKTMKMTVLK
ncbi:MAG: T9SS type A sorting domain-containing protein [Ignavibacteria bacterium]|nr:T9SS type A sorting domain-containing protein [Ignavibacteria bacterium]